MRLEKKLRIILNDIKRYKPERVILFGSGARGEDDRYSDLDIVIIKDTKKSFLQRLKEVALMCPSPDPTDFFVYTPAELKRMKEEGNPFIEKVLREGRVIYER